MKNKTWSNDLPQKEVIHAYIECAKNTPNGKPSEAKQTINNVTAALWKASEKIGSKVVIGKDIKV